MRRALSVIAALAVWGAVGVVAMGAESPIGTIIGTIDAGTVTNGTTLNPFAVPYSSKITIQCDGTCWTDVGRDGKRVTVSTLFYDAGTVGYDGGCLGYTQDGGPRCLAVTTVSYDPVTTTNMFTDAGVSLTAGTKLSADQLFPTSTPAAGVSAQARYSDAGIVPNSSIVRLRCNNAVCNANVFVRTGTE